VVVELPEVLLEVPELLFGEVPEVVVAMLMLLLAVVSVLTILLELEEVVP